MKYKATLLFLILAFISCQQEDKPSTEANLPYFPLSEYLDTEIKILKDRKPTFRKYVEFNEEKDEIIMDSIDYKQVFNILKDYDINKPNLAGSYTIDTTQRKDTIIVHYKNNVRKLALKNAEYYYLQEEIVKLRFKENKDGLFSSSRQIVEYLPEKSITITKNSEMWFMPPTSSRYKITFE